MAGKGIETFAVEIGEHGGGVVDFPFFVVIVVVERTTKSRKNLSCNVHDVSSKYEVDDGV